MAQPTTINKATATTDAFKYFYWVVSAIEDPYSGTRTKWWYSTWPEEKLDSKSDYPIGIISSPSLIWEKSTFRKKKLKGTISFEIYSTKSSEADDLTQKIKNAMADNRSSAYAVNIRNIKLDSTNVDMAVQHGKIRLHPRSVDFSFEIVVTGDL